MTVQGDLYLNIIAKKQMNKSGMAFQREMKTLQKKIKTK